MWDSINSILDEQLSSRWRYEKKIVIDEHQYYYLLDMIKAHPLGFATNFPDRSINNIYFELPNFCNYFNHVGGVQSRQKIRIRWYGPFQFANKPKLEFKIKESDVGNKLCYNIPSFQFTPTLRKADICDLIDRSTDLSSELKRYLKAFSPILVNSYDRSYFISMDKKVRLTIDRNISYSRFSSIGYQQPLRQNHKPPCIVELKYDNECDLKDFKLGGLTCNYLGKYSKYIAGIETFFINFASNIREAKS